MAARVGVLRSREKPVPFPTRGEILTFIRANPDRSGRREIARAFRLDGGQKAALNAILVAMARDGLIGRGRGRADTQVLPPVTMVEITGTDTDGEVVAKPSTWPDRMAPPVIYMASSRRGHPALAPGDRVLARLRRIRDGTYEGKTIRRITNAPQTVLGIYDLANGRGQLRPADRRHRNGFDIARADSRGAEPGELVQAHILPGRRLGLRQARVIKRLGAGNRPTSVSLIALHDHGIPPEFGDDTLAAAEAAGPAPADNREDLRGLPLVTIDGADARDFDDAVWAEADPDRPGGWHLLVAIADVAWYVRCDGALDRAAFERGNSVYLPDRVVPMLPEAISNGWCSLKPGEDRPCLAVHLWIGPDGAMHRHRFVRGLMRSASRLTYDQVQAARDGEQDGATRPLMKSVIEPLYGAYAALAEARRVRGVLDLDLPERRIDLADDGSVLGIAPEPRYASHRLIEEFMIAANVAAAETLEERRQPAMYRVHDEPGKEKLETLRDFMGTVGLKMARGQVIEAAMFNRILEKAAGTPHARLVAEMVLRSQAQAAYSPVNIGHFGLALRRYCHFTSPIRRYADLLVHRALIRGLALGEGGLETESQDFARIGEHLSMTERRAIAAERDTLDRFTAAYLADRVGATFVGHVAGVTRFGLFVTLDESGGDGLVPVRSLPGDAYVHDGARHELRGRRTGRRYRLGEAMEVRLAEANPVTGGLILELVEGAAAARDRGSARRGAPR